MAEDMIDRLCAFFAEQLPGTTPRVLKVVKTSLGRSRQNWAFDLEWQDGDELKREPLILRRDPTGGLVETERWKEFAILRALEATSVPAPAAKWLDADGEWFGRPSLIMRRENGACDYHVLSSKRSLDERLRLAEQFCDLLAEVHGVDWRSSQLVELLDHASSPPSVAQVDKWESVFRRDQPEAYPEIELAIHWLRETAPPAQATVLVHGDFKPGNILLDGARITALLDWELTHLGDPLEDLGWVTQPLRRREHIIPGVWEDAQIVARYERASGFTIDPRHVAWWNVFATFRTAVMQVSGLRSFLEGRSEEPFRPTAMVLRSLVDAAAA